MFVTHDVEEALRLADKIIIMRAGTIVQYDTPLNIITRPRDSFVQELVGAEDMLRRLSLIKVGNILAARPRGDGVAAFDGTAARQPATIGPDDDLRTALSELLRSATDTLTAVGEDGRPLGQISFADIRAATAGRAQGVEA
jgi:osmoprotectant transport system ATP-binding protein